MNQNLVALLTNNQGIEIKAPIGVYEILNAWNDKSLSFNLKKRQNLTSLRNIKFPEQLVAIYHAEQKRIEFIYGAVKKEDKLNNRNFEFLFKGNNFKCSFGAISDSLTLLAKSFKELTTVAIPLSKRPTSYGFGIATNSISFTSGFLRLILPAISIRSQYGASNSFVLSAISSALSNFINNYFCYINLLIF